MEVGLSEVATNGAHVVKPTKSKLRPAASKPQRKNGYHRTGSRNEIVSQGYCSGFVCMLSRLDFLEL